jgi:hypothetical protein
VYGSKDVFKLHFPMRDGRVYRELPFVSTVEASQDLQNKPVYTALYLRSRGVANEDGWNQKVLDSIAQEFQTEAGPISPTGLLQYSRVLKIKRP